MVFGMLCNSSDVGAKASYFGNDIDKAIWQSKKNRIHRTKIAEYEILDKNEFDFERRRIGVIVKNKTDNVLIAKARRRQYWQFVKTHEATAEPPH